MLQNPYANATASNNLHTILGGYSSNHTEIINSNGHITIDARQGNDVVEISQQGLFLKISVNGTDRIEANVCQTKTLTIFGNEGDDILRVDPSVTFPLTLVGGSGSDQINARNPSKNTIIADRHDTLFVKSSDLPINDRWQTLMNGKSLNDTICLPMPQSPYVPEPLAYVPLNPDEPSKLTQEQIQNMWNQTLYDATNQSIMGTTQDMMRKEEEKSKKLQSILILALKSGNLDMAVLLISGLETSRANGITAGLLARVEALQEQRKVISQQMSNLGNGAQDAQKVSGLNVQASNIATEISLLQTFLQEVSSQKQEAQQLTSNFIKSRHESAMGIIRNFA